MRARQCPRLTPRLAAQCQPQSSSAEKHEAGISDPSQTRTHTESFSLATEAKRRTRWFTERRPGASRTFKQSSPGILIPLPLATKDRRGARSRALDVCAQERRTQWPRMNGKGQGTPVLHNFGDSSCFGNVDGSQKPSRISGAGVLLSSATLTGMCDTAELSLLLEG